MLCDARQHQLDMGRKHYILAICLAKQLALTLEHVLCMLSTISSPYGLLDQKTLMCLSLLENIVQCF